MTDFPPAPAWRELPGPVDRESFMAAQQRQRRASWRLTALIAFTVALLGVPLSVVLSPLLLGVALLAYDTAGLLVHVPSLFGTLPQRFEHGDSAKAIADVARTPALALLLLPGALFLVVCWLTTRHRLRAEAAGVALLATARPVRSGNLEEHQLENLVDAVAIAAGLRAPAVRVIDSDVANAGIAGTSHEDAVVIVTTGLLAQLGRYETEGVVAHLVAAIGAGDVHRARSLQAFFATVDWIERVLGVGKNRKACLGALFTPITVTGAAFTFNASAVSDTTLQRLLRGRWRHRVLLADATAVELTRYPDGLAKALADIGAEPSVVPEARHVSADGADEHSELLVVAPVGYHPPLEARMSQLVRIGSTVDMVGGRRVNRTSARARAVVWLVLSPLFVLIGALLVAMVVASIGATMVIVGLYLFIPVAIAHALLVGAGR